MYMSKHQRVHNSSDHVTKVTLTHTHALGNGTDKVNTSQQAQHANHYKILNRTHLQINKSQSTNTARSEPREMCC